MKGAYRCPARVDAGGRQCLAELHVYGKRSYIVHPDTGAVMKSGEQVNDVVCGHAHVLIEDAVNVAGALRLLLEPDRASIVDSHDFGVKLSKLINAAVAHDKVGLDDAEEGLKHFLRRYLSTTEAA